MDRNEFDELERDIAANKERADRASQRLNAGREACRHKWGDTRYDPDRKGAYTTTGDPLGTMGVDWRGPVNVPAKTTKRWTRECELCGLVQITTSTKKEHIPGKVAGTGGQIDMPSFPTGNRL